MNLFDELKNAGEELPIPDSLSPAAIEKKLQKSSAKPHKKEIKKLFISVASLAACLLLLVRQEPQLTQPNIALQETVAAIHEETGGEQEAAKEPITYEDLYQTMHSLYKNQEEPWYKDILYGFINDSKSTEEIAMDDGAADSIEFSDTNKQEANVDEEDYVKTDGEYIYYLEDSPSSDLHIVKADGGNLKETAVISAPNSPKGFYLNENQLILIETGTAHSAQNSQTSYTTVSFYDITDKTKPELTDTLTMEGYYGSSRVYDNYLYIFSTYYLQEKPNPRKPETFVPLFDGKPLSADCIVIPENPTEPSYLNIASVNLSAPQAFADYKAVLSGGKNQYYVSEESIYVASSNYNHFSQEGKTSEQKTNFTELFRFSYQKGAIKCEATGKAPGRLMDDFAMNAHDGYLRMVTTVENYDHKEIKNDLNGTSLGYNTTVTTDNSLYVLDPDLTIIGRLEHLAPEERIYSARFMGDTGYFVTFRQMDPLFSVDLSDPWNPKLLGELKIPGFSEYLHPYSDTLLFGIGEEVDPGTGERKGLKLSMFDISNPADVREIDKVVLSDIEHSEAWYDYKSVLIDPEKNLIGFSGENWKDGYENEHYYLYQHDKNTGFIQKFALSWNEYHTMRGIYIGDTLYVLNRFNLLEAYSLETGKMLGELEANYERK